MSKEVNLELVKGLIIEEDKEKIKGLLNNIWDKYYEALKDSYSDEYMKCIIIPPNSYCESDIKNCIYWALKEGYKFALSELNEVKDNE
jgi:hypothetical protein